MTIQMIPLTKLIPCPANVRKTGAMAGIDELAASIAAHGLLQNLQVRPGANGKFEVVAGARRLTALKRLAKDKVIAKSEEIACHVLADDNAAEISLAENLIRLPMHPADQFEAFKALHDQGKGPEEIAGRFGCSQHTVRQRLKLASVAPSLIAAYRADAMNLDQLMAFTVSDDQAAQEKVWSDLPPWNCDPGIIRRQLTSAHIDCRDRRVRFLGVEAYIAGGGHVLRDLFDEQHQGYLTDPALLDRLVAEKLEVEAEAIRAEGWSWIEIVPEIGYDRLDRMKRVYPEREPPSEAQQAEIDELTARYEALVAEHGDDPADEVMAEIEDLSDRIDMLSEGTVRWLPEDVACAGAVIGIGHNGNLAVVRGLLRAEDAAVTTRQNKKAGAVRSTNRSPALPDRLTENLTAQRTAALRVELAGNPDVALTAVAHALALPVFFPQQSETCLAVKLESAPLHGSADGIEDGPALKALADQRALWLRRLPSGPESLWDWLIAQDTATRLDLLAYCAGCSINAVKKRHERMEAGRFQHADRLTAALGLDMNRWWQPTGDSYLRHVSKALILEAVREGVTPEAAENLMKLKKDALVAEAENRLNGTGWLPAIFRTSVAAAAATAPAIAAD